MTAAQPDPYAETVRLLSADTFTQQTRDEWIEIAARAHHEFCFHAAKHDWREHASDMGYVLSKVLAHIAAQQARPMPGGSDQ